MSESREVFFSFSENRKGKVIPYRGTEDRKGAGTNSGESGARTQETESVRNRAEECNRVCKVEDTDRNKTEQCA